MTGNLVRGAVLLLIAPLVTGIIKKLKALLQGRYGPPIWQPYLDLFKLMGKRPVVSRYSSWLTRVAPYVFVGSTVLAAALIPAAGAGIWTARNGDLILVIGLFALGRFFMALVGLDAASAFGGMGSSREMIVAALAEPAMLMTLLTVAVPAGSTNLGVLASHTALSGAGDFTLPRMLSLAAFVMVVLAETGRIPVDNPDTHLELTMIHEGMVLELSGRYLACIQWGASVKQLALFVLLGSAFLPGPQAGVWALSLRVGEVAAISALVALTESSLAKIRLFKVPGLLGASFLLSLFAMAAQMVLGV